MSAGTENLPSRAWLMVGLLWLVACLNYLDRLILVTMRSSIMEAIPMSEARFGMLTTIFLVTYGLLSPFGGFIADKFNRSRTIVFSLFTWSMATWLTAHASSFGELLFYRALMGISEACYFPAAAALLMDYHRHNTRSLANGLHLSGVMLGSGLGGLGGLIAERHGWAFVFEFFGITGAVYAIILVALLRDRPATEMTAAGSAAESASQVRLGEALRSLFSLKAFYLAVFFWGLLGFASWAFIGWLPTYLQEQFDISQGRAGMISLGYIFSASLVGMVVSGIWADRWSLKNPRARVWVGVIGILVAAPSMMLATNAAPIGLMLLGLVCYGFSRPFPDTNMVPIICQIIDRRYLATGVGVLNTFATLVGGASIYIGGVLRDAHVSLSTIFNFGAGSMLFCAVVLWRIRPKSTVSS